MITQQDLANGILELQAAQQKTDAQIAETAKQQAKTDVQLAKTDAQLAKTAAQLPKTDAKLDRLAMMYGGVANNQGDVAEEFYFNSLKQNPTLNNITFDSIDKHVTRNYHGIEDEYDIVLVNSADVFIIEVKYKAHANDLQRLVHNKAVNFRKIFPEYREFRHHLGLAALHINDDLKARALSQGVTVLQRKGDVIATTKPAAA